MPSLRGLTFKVFEKYPVIFVLTVTVLLGLVAYPVWFTQVPSVIDNWFYWGAGDNPTLAYRNNFGDLYYLERYVLIAPQILFHFVFGPFYAQLAVAVFWLYVAIHFSYKLAITYLEPNVAAIFLVFFYSSRGTLLSFGSNLHHPATIALSVIIIYLLITNRNYKVKRKVIPNITLVGIVFAMIANAYLAIASYIFFPITICVIARSFGGNFLKRLEPKEIRSALRKFIKSAIHFLGGFLGLSAVFELIHQLSSTTNSTILLDQLRLGANLLGNKNPWGSNGFIDFWSNGIFDLNAMPWIVMICSGIALTFFSQRLTKAKSYEKYLFIGILLGLFVQTMGYSNPLIYSWTACILVPFYLLLALWTTGFVADSISKKNQALIVILVGGAYFSTQVILTKFWLLKPEIFYKASYVLTSAVLLALVFFIFQREKYIVKAKSFQRLQLKMIISTGLIFTSLLPQSIMQFYNADNYGFTSYNRANSFYQDLSNKGKLILEAMNSRPAETRIWLTPDDGISLASTRLYGYSLIGFENGKPNCGQVEWALQNPNSWLMSFSKVNFDVEALNKYLIPCNASLEDVHIKSGKDSLEKYRYVIGKITKVETPSMDGNE